MTDLSVSYKAKSIFDIVSSLVRVLRKALPNNNFSPAISNLFLNSINKLKYLDTIFRSTTPKYYATNQLLFYKNIKNVVLLGQSACTRLNTFLAILLNRIVKRKKNIIKYFWHNDYNLCIDMDKIIIIFSCIVINAINAIFYCKYKFVTSNSMVKENFDLQPASCSCFITKNNLQHILKPNFITFSNGLSLGLSAAHILQANNISKIIISTTVVNTCFK